MDTSLIINSTNSDKKVSKAISNINPEKDNAVLKTFAQKVNALTTNNYVDATRVNKMSVNEATTKPEPTLTISSGTYTYDGDGDVYGYAEHNGTVLSVKINRTEKTFNVLDTMMPATEYTITLYATETANFAAKSVTYTNTMPG